MSQILTKPVFLDETGQDIADKLDDIKDAIISSSGEFVPLMIRVTTPPTKTNYLAGETLDLTGMVVTLIGSNGASYEVTPACTFSPAEGATLTSGTTRVNISYTYPKDSLTFTSFQDIVVKELSSIAVTTPPTQTEYMFNETLDLTGIVVTATYDNGSTAVVTSECTFSPDDGDTLTLSDTAITVSYTEGTVTKTATQAITVSAPIYGAEWDGTATSAWTRTDLAADFTDPTSLSNPFDSILPWSGLQEKTISCGDSGTGVFIEIPKFYYKWTRDGAKMKLQISMYELDGFHVSPAHADRGDGVGERDYVYVGKYHSSGQGVPRGDAVGLASSTSYTQRGFARSFYDSLRTNSNLNIFMWDYAMWWTINMLYLVEYADWDSSTKIGLGCYIQGYSSNYASREDQDGITYHTGNNNGYTKYRNIVNLWTNLVTYIEGIRFQKNGSVYDVYAIKNPNEFSDTTGGTVVESRSGFYFGGGYIKEWSDPEQIDGFEYALIPIDNVSSDNPSYVCDYSGITNYSSKDYWVLTTAYGYYAMTSYCERAGLFALGNQTYDSQSTNASDKCGTRAMILPPSRIV